MPCYRPLQAFRTATGVVFSERRGHDHLGQIELPCGQCIGCRMARAGDWELRVMHEASRYDRNCFLTLTYAPGQLPPFGSLRHEDFQLFMKRLRIHKARTLSDKSPLRFYMCGEYGDQRSRPHYHACIFNFDFDDALPEGRSKSGQLFYSSATLTKLWGLGIATVQPLVRETASYCARYIMKKALGQDAKTAYQVLDPDTGELHQRRPEYSAMSLRPGIGAAFVDQYCRDLYPHDFTVLDGTRRPVPKYYDRRARRAGVDLSDVELKREQRAKAHFADQTDERRAAAEAVHLAKVRTLTRN